MRACPLRFPIAISNTPHQDHSDREEAIGFQPLRISANFKSLLKGRLESVPLSGKNFTPNDPHVHFDSSSPRLIGRIRTVPPGAACSTLTIRTRFAHQLGYGLIVKLESVTTVRYKQIILLLGDNVRHCRPPCVLPLPAAEQSASPSVDGSAQPPGSVSPRPDAAYAHTPNRGHRGLRRFSDTSALRR